jgi:hypothetical protein
LVLPSSLLVAFSDKNGKNESFPKEKKEEERERRKQVGLVGYYFMQKPFQRWANNG